MNLVQPGSTDTDMNPADSENADGQRSLTAVAHLASDAARQITSASILVDGGANA